MLELNAQTIAFFIFALLALGGALGVVMARNLIHGALYLIVSLFGGLFMLASLIGLYVVSLREFGAGTFDFLALTQLGMDASTQRMLFLGFFFAFAVKAPLWPFHTWLPDAATEAQPGSAVLLVGVLDKVGTFGMLRYCLPIFPEASPAVRQ